MHLRVALTAVFVTLLTTNVSFSQEVEKAAEGWMKFLQGKWTYSILATGATGDWIVEKTAVKNVLSAKGIDKDGRAFLAGVYVWDRMPRRSECLWIRQRGCYWLIHPGIERD